MPQGEENKAHKKCANQYAYILDGGDDTPTSVTVCLFHGHRASEHLLSTGTEPGSRNSKFNMVLAFMDLQVHWGEMCIETSCKGVWVVQLVKRLLRLRSSSQGPGIDSSDGLPAQWGVSFFFSHCPSSTPVCMLSLSNKMFCFVLFL